MAGTTLHLPKHRRSTRLWHWFNLAVVCALLGSGLGIFNAHPRLYWGAEGTRREHALLEIGSSATTGYVRAFGHRVDTTGVLGLWHDEAGVARHYAFPLWATLPGRYSLALSRRWHLTFAWLLALGGGLYALWSLGNRHLARDLLPARAELAPRHLWHEVREHARLRFPHGADAVHYNTLQKLAYLGVLLALLPGLVLTGMAMSPAIDAAWPALVDVLGGRQSARTLHFAAAFTLVAFVLVHLAMLLASGPIEGLRSMLLGTLRVREAAPSSPTPAAEAPP